jgi:hypothetical protein
MYSLGTGLVATKLDIVLVQDTRQNIFQVAGSLLSGIRANNAQMLLQTTVEACAA